MQFKFYRGNKCIDLFPGDSVMTRILPIDIPDKCQLYAAWDSEKRNTFCAEHSPFSISKACYTLTTLYNHHKNYIKAFDTSF